MWPYLWFGHEPAQFCVGWLVMITPKMETMSKIKATQKMKMTPKMQMRTKLVTRP